MGRPWRSRRHHYHVFLLITQLLAPTESAVSSPFRRHLHVVEETTPLTVEGHSPAAPAVSDSDQALRVSTVAAAARTFLVQLLVADPLLSLALPRGHATQLTQLMGVRQSAQAPGDPFDGVFGKRPTKEDEEDPRKTGRKPPKLKKLWSMTDRAIIASVWLTLVLITAIIYRYCKVYPLVNPADVGQRDLRFADWRYGLLGCTGNFPICMWSFFCPAIRWADTMDMVSLMYFWLGLLCFVAVIYVGFIVGVLLIFIFFLALGLTVARSQFRAKLHMEVSVYTYAVDFSQYCFCLCCAVAQDAQQIEAAAKSGHSAIKVIEDDERIVPDEQHD
eukprot:gnl/TRDRNA2_/TRDRNA2_192678_c0_seq1.p1 gnl/TRDRNA2_/TRDRNA2_192678_c0~~gnl/TRDRNA2_/TRDRNA2_192678_c0_seq1.p1  ORF type:complete len:332 (+),score=38.80 gnl/TRDRNA2_/TRDRNA2_192678_c0_seq1:50-1045(+)